MLYPHFRHNEIEEYALRFCKPFTDDNISQTGFLLLNLHFSLFSIKCNNQITWNHRQLSSWLLSLLLRALSQAKLRLKGYACTAWRFSPGTLDLGKCRYFFFSLSLSFLLFQSASLFSLLIIHVLICSSQAVEKWQGRLRQPWAWHLCTATLEG